MLLTAGTLIAGTLAAVTGFGGAAILLPMVIATFGVRDAIPILTVAQLIGNASREWFNRCQLNLAVVRWFSFGAIPAAILGALLFAQAPSIMLTRLLGGFLLLTVAYRHVRKNQASAQAMRLQAFLPLGACFAFLSALLGSIGPLMAPFFLAYGLVKGAYIGTEACASVVMHVTKLLAYGGTSTLTLVGVRAGVIMGIGLLCGSYIGVRIVDRLPPNVFVLVVEATLLISGLRFLLV
jgi:uncharacterized membrane protein YfcA